MVQNKPAVHLFAITVLLAVTTLVYSNSFQGEFTLDDFVNIHNSHGIRSFQPTIDGIISAATDEPNGGRWLANLSFAINFYLHGENIWGYHLVNLFVHLAGTVVLYFLCLSTLNLPIVNKQFIRKNEIAFIATLLWAVHPLQTNGVTYIVQRMTSMAALFYLTSLLCYIKGRLIPHFCTRQLFLFIASLLFWCLAITSKENAYMLPVIILAYEIFFLSRENKIYTSKKIGLWITAVTAVILFIAVLFLGKNIYAHIFEIYKYRDFTMGERLLTESRVIFLYLSLIALPLPSRLNLNHDIILSQGLLSPPQTVASIIGIFALVALIPFLFNKNRLLSFGIFWFLGNLLIESTIIPLELIYEHRLYLPTTFLILALTASLFTLAHNNIWVVRTCCIIIISLFSLWTWQRNQVWGNNLTLWSDVMAKSPNSERACNNLGTVYHDRKQYREAEQLFLRAIRLAPESRQAYVSLGSLYITQNRYQEAMQMLQTGMAKQPYLNGARIYHYMGIIYGKTGLYQEAINAAQTALQLNPDDLEPLVTMGIAYANIQNYQKADSIFSEAKRLGLEGTNLYNNWGTVVFKMGHIDRSIEYFKKALEFDPDHPESHYNLGLAYGAKGMVKAARDEMKRSMELQQKAQHSPQNK